MTAIRIGIDTSGTFTDLVAVDSQGRSFLAKVPSIPENPVAAIAQALAGVDIDASDVELVVVGTTIGINAVLTRQGARVVYVTTRGFEDIPYIQRINRKHHYDFRWRKPAPLVRRRDCIGVVERLDEEGRVLTPLDAEALVAELDARSLDGDAAVAVCLLFSYLNPEHELAVRDALFTRFPDLPVSLSHEVAPIWREYERGTTVTVDAFTKPLFEATRRTRARKGGGRWVDVGPEAAKPHRDTVSRPRRSHSRRAVDARWTSMSETLATSSVRRS